MSMYTRCPHCETHFRVTREQLQASSGQVRCGRCQEVFDAFATLAAQLPPTPPKAPTLKPPPVILSDAKIPDLEVTAARARDVEVPEVRIAQAPIPKARATDPKVPDAGLSDPRVLEPRIQEARIPEPRIPEAPAVKAPETKAQEIKSSQPEIATVSIARSRPTIIVDPPAPPAAPLPARVITPPAVPVLAPRPEAPARQVLVAPPAPKFADTPVAVGSGAAETEHSAREILSSTAPPPELLTLPYDMFGGGSLPLSPEHRRRWIVATVLLFLVLPLQALYFFATQL
ncbi:MAG: MJ0042-type zinc finger domain-containing protein, partial [Betaproteobacteria bacterium]